MTYLAQTRPIWIINVGVFSAASMKLIFNHIFNHLPYYKVGENKALLKRGVTVPGEIKKVNEWTVPRDFDIHVLICEGNEVALDIAQEIQDALPLKKRDKMKIRLVKNDDMNHGSRKELINSGGQVLINDISENSLVDGRVNESPSRHCRHVGRSIQSIAIDDWWAGTLKFYQRETLKDELVEEQNEDRTTNSIGQNSMMSNNLSGKNQLFPNNTTGRTMKSISIHDELLYQREVRKVILLYLNKDTFDGDRSETDEDSALESTLKTLMLERCWVGAIILVHEQDYTNKGAREFDYFLDKFPPILKDPKHSIHTQTRVPLYTKVQYRDDFLMEV